MDSIMIWIRTPYLHVQAIGVQAASGDARYKFHQNKIQCSDTRSTYSLRFDWLFSFLDRRRGMRDAPFFRYSGRIRKVLKS